MTEKQTRLFGQKGEELAADFLKKKGYRIVEQNFRVSFGEIDIIAWDRETLVFIEVKTRKSIRYAMPFEAVNSHKIKKLSDTALFYLKKFKNIPPARFDVLTIYYESGKPCIELIRDAFELSNTVF
ncbi:MAG TPA: YraN family protein [Thermodesulfovibrionia bacterium]|nr:YraN family protein [Thermodesulfovibrionia bacterium]